MPNTFIVAAASPEGTVPVAARTVEMVEAFADMDAAVHPPDTFQADTLLDSFDTVFVGVAGNTVAAVADMVVAAASYRKPSVHRVPP